MICKNIIIYYEVIDNPFTNINICYDDKKNIINIPFFYRNNCNFKIENNKLIKDNIEQVEIKEKCFLFIVDYQSNFHHFMTEMAYLMNFYNNSYYLCIQKNVPKFILEYIQSLNINTSKILFLDEKINYKFTNMFIYTLNVKTNKKIEFMMNVNKKLLYNNLDSYPEKIFIYRKNNKRKLLNSDKVYDILKNNGFYFFSPEESDLKTQISLMQNCKILCCELGAGCCNMFFLNKNAKMIILSFSNWSKKYLFFNNITKLNITTIEGKLIKGNEHNCEWIIDEKLFLN